MDYNRMNANHNWHSYHSIPPYWDQLHRMLSPIVPYSEYSASLLLLHVTLNSPTWLSCTLPESMGPRSKNKQEWTLCWLKQQHPSVWPVSFYQYNSGLCTTHALPPALPPLFPCSLFSLQFCPNNWRVQFWPPPSHSPTRFYLRLLPWLSKTALFAGQHEAASVASATRAPFSELFNMRQKSIINMTVTWNEEEIKQNAWFKSITP